MSRQDDVQKLIQIYTRRLQKLQEQQAVHGLSTPPAILIEIEDIEQKIEMLQVDLQDAKVSDTSTNTPPQKMSDNEIARELTKLESKDKPKGDVNIGGVNFGNISGSTINIGGNVESNLSAGGDIVGGDKTVNIHYHGEGEKPVEEKPRQPYEPDMIIIPAGPFTMGSDDEEAHESPPHTLDLPDYEISQYPITNAQYFAYVKQANAAVSNKTGWELARVGHAPPTDKLAHPVVGISWDEAVAYCQWLQEQTGRRYRLPTEAEWEKAARGADDTRVYPWGDDWGATRANSNGQETTPIDQYPPQSPYQCGDMAGNVWEWTSTMWGRDRSTPDFDYPYPAPGQPDGRDGPPAEGAAYREYRICRGGSFKDKPERLRCSARARYAADSQNVRRGFRVVREL